jgi:ketosteroid isomerase-like protein
MKISRKAAVVRTAAAAVGLLLIAATTAAHDFWLIPNAFLIAPGNVLEVRGQTSSRFPTSEGAVGPDRVAGARIIDASGATPLRDLPVAEKSLLIRQPVRTPGQKIVAVTTRPRSVRESAEGFRHYLVVESPPEALERYQREGKLPTDSITRRYTKYAKTFVEVGSGGPRVYQQAVDHPLEFIPLSDPAALRAGDTLGVRLLLRGQPLAGVKVHASGVPADLGLTAAAAERAQEVTVHTDAHGVARIPVGRAGLWNARTIHIEPAPAGSGADWDTHWVSLVFGAAPGAGDHTAPAGSGARVLGTLVPGAASDSAEVAGVVDRFHGALVDGDTAAVLRLLAPDVVVQESGGVETLSEYRSHHLPGDMAFARAVKRERSPIRVQVAGDVAWATSTSTTVGEYRGRAINSQGAELMVLRRDPEGWRIVAIHWSSRARRS